MIDILRTRRLRSEQSDTASRRLRSEQSGYSESFGWDRQVQQSFRWFLYAAMVLYAVINGVTLWVVAWLSGRMDPSLHIDGFWPLVLAALIVTAANWFLRFIRPPRPPQRPPPPPVPTPSISHLS